MPMYRFVIRHLRPLSLIPAALALTACPYPKILGDSPLTGATESSGTDTDGTASDATGTPMTEPTTAGPPLMCDNPAFTCSQPVDCEQWDCGSVSSPFDANGCLRPSCEDSPCAADEICYDYNPADATDCSPGAPSCANVGDACECEVGETCSTLYCIPADEGPPVDCPALREMDECLASTHCGWTSEQPFWTKPGVDAECMIDEVEPLCTFAPALNRMPVLQEVALFEIATGRAVLFPIETIPLPHGWGRCSDPEAPPSCDCITGCSMKQEAATQFLEEDKPCTDVSDCALAEGICFTGNTCGNVGVHKDNLEAWDALHAELGECCDGADPCGADLACEEGRCMAVFPP